MLAAAVGVVYRRPIGAVVTVQSSAPTTNVQTRLEPQHAAVWRFDAISSVSASRDRSHGTSYQLDHVVEAPTVDNFDRRHNVLKRGAP